MAVAWQSREQGWNSTADIVVTKPTGVASGDLMIVTIEVDDPGVTMSSVPSGWTEKYSGADGDGKAFIYYKIAGGSEGSSYTWTQTGGATYNHAWTISRITGGRTSGDPFHQFSAEAETSATTYVTPAITTTINDCLMYAGAGTDGSSGAPWSWTTDDTDYTERCDISDNGPGLSVTNATRSITGTISSDTCTFTISASTGRTATSFNSAIDPMIDYYQEGFRWRNDDGDETGASWKETQDINTTIATGTNLRLRVLVDLTGDPGSEGMTLQYRKSGDSDLLWEDLVTGG